MEGATRKYLPALEYHWLTPFYDTVLRIAMPERRLRDIVFRALRDTTGDRILDVGCGTGTQLGGLQPRSHSAVIVGLDIDLPILRIAGVKLAGRTPPIPLVCGSATSLPFPDGSFDRVISFLVLHHLTMAEKQHSIGEAHRVLSVRGELHIADFGVPSNALMRYASRVSAILEDRVRMADNVAGTIPEACQAAGFRVDEVAALSTIFGTVSVLKCSR